MEENLNSIIMQIPSKSSAPEIHA